jgi:hypothetical protein
MSEQIPQFPCGGEKVGAGIIISRRTTGWIIGGGGVAAIPEERRRHFNNLRGQHATAAAVGWSFIGLGAAAGIYLTFIF